MKILVGANRPLTAAEFREALSVVPGDISWDPGKLINNIYSTVACCGSLVIIDEEERTFRLVHQSVAQFLLAKTAESLEWSFSAKEANSHMGDITVTYLNYGVFDQRVSTAVIPRMYAGETPERIVSQALEPYGIIGKVAMSLLKTQHAANHDIGKTLSKAGNLRQGPKATAETYDLLGYSSTNWLIHTGDISDESSMFPLWRYLLSHPRFGKLPWDTNEESSNAFTVDEGSGIIWGLHPQVRWAISHSHLPLFLTEIRSRSGMKALCSVCPYLTGLMHTNPNIKLASHICDKLLLISTFFQAGEPTDWLLRMHNYSIEQYLMLLRKQENWEYSIFRWAIVRDPFQGLHDSSEPLVEEAVRHSDARTVKILLDRGARLDIHLHEAPLRTAVRSCFSNPENLPMVADMLEVATWADVALVHESDIFVYLHVYTNHSDVFSIDQKLFWGGDGPPHLVMEKFLRRACRRGDYKLIKALMSSVELDAVHHSNLLCEALFARSSERTRIVRLLLDSQATHSSLPFASLSVALSRSIQLRDWDSAKTLARAMGLGLATSRAFSTDLRIVYMCIDIRDTAGLGFLLEYTTPSLHQVTLCPEMVCYDDLRSVTPVTYTLNSTWDTTEDCYELLKVAKHLLRCTYSGPPATNDLTEPYAHLESALKFGASMLRTLFISAAVPRGYSSLGLRDHHDQGVNLSHEPDPDALIEVSAFTESIRVRSSALCLLDELLRQLPGPGSYRATLLETLQCVLESYHTATTLLHMFHGADVEQAGVPPAVDKVNELKLGLVRIAETLLNKCDASRMKGELKMCFQISPYFAKYRHMRHWHLQGIMEYILRAHGVVIGEFGVGIPQVDPPQEFYLPLQVEALALGHPFQHIISKARNRVPEPVDRWSSMVEAYLIRTATEFREDGRMRNVIKMWRDAAGFDEQEVELVKASSPVSIMISGGAVVG